MHPLDGAYQRVRRAGIHLTNLNRRVTALCKAIIDGVVGERKPQTLQIDGREVEVVLGKASIPFSPIPPIISILVGETIYNLRAALDYLVYELACFDAKSIVKDTQFPIQDTEESFWAWKKKRLKGVSDKHVAALKRLQPCDGCDWTKVLASISNPDKHMHLTVVRSPVTIHPSKGSTEAIIASGKAVDVKSDVSVYIAFSDGTPVIDTLKQLKLEVAQTLDAFKSEFE